MPNIHPIGTNHDEYRAALPKWIRARDACSGSDTIKAKGDIYLPRLSAHKGILGEEKYQAYKQRAVWYNASRRTKIGLSGAATLKPTKKEIVNARGKAFAERIDKCRHELIEEVLEVGRYAIVVNQQANAEAFFTIWWAESIVNWRYEYIEGKKRLAMLVLEDVEKVFTNDNPYSPQEKTVRHSYVLKDINPTQTICVYSRFIKMEKSDEQWAREGDEKILSASGGRTLDFIPATIRGPLTEDENEIEDSLLLDLIDINLSHYMNSADLEHGQHWTALPTAVASGFPETDKDGNPVEFNVGGENAWITSIPGASAFYLEFSGSGLGCIRSSMQDKKSEMAILGARLLEEPKPSVESSETLKTRLSGEKSVLNRVAIGVGSAMTWTLRLMLWFQDPLYDREKATDTMKLNTEFLEHSLSTEELQVLMTMLQEGGISYTTYFTLLQNAELIPDTRTEEEEKMLIDKGRPGTTSKDPFAQSQMPVNSTPTAGMMG